MEHSIFEIVIVTLFSLFALAFLCYAAYRMVRNPSEEELQNVREWLLGQVTNAEKELGGGTGALKLRMVYDAFLTRFPWLAKVINFELFAELVDDALVIMRDMLDKNDAAAAYVEGIEA